MANFLQRVFGVTEVEERWAQKLEEAQHTTELANRNNSALAFDNGNLRESMHELSLYLEDLNWIPVDGWEEEKGFSIETIKENSDRLRAMLTVNPTIKKAINTRVGYIWGRGVTFEKTKGKSEKAMLANAYNKRVLFDDVARWKLEAQLATDGNIWTAKNKTTEEVVMIPINQIAGWVLDENDPTRVLYWLRRYTVITKNFNTGVENPAKHIEVFYPSHDNTTGTVPTIDGIKVDRNITMVHLAANRQEGWVLGIPDIMAAMFWAKAHKELFEAGTTYVKAQGKFASKVVSKTNVGATNAAARIADSPRRDPQSGEVLDSGGTAVMSGGLDYQLMGKMSGGVDFRAFDPVAALVAVGLGVPLDVLLGTSGAEEISLEQSVVDEMKMRQALWGYYFRALFGTEREIKVIWPKIKQEPTYRQIQSIEISNKTITLHPEELRALTLEAYGIEGEPSDLPDPEKNNAVLLAKAIGDNAAKHAEDLAQQNALVTTPEQGVDAGIGKLSTGKDSKDSRNNKADKNTKNT